ncbi:hypothetical protein ASJ30_12030 [Janibacter indicus]|uniref:CAAX prenyl protease 2/Lysostaphin resistance protein A-like domain-containing protein n=1 Tax=Janibacter indicus TaxID=857417 RepID=A0A1L3MIC0_9MICO|nr:hypothetical protein ASJ30_12030 [Janibacter indicus]
MHQMRGPGHRWWQPLVALLVSSIVAVVGIGLVTGVFAAAGLVTSEEQSMDVLDPMASLSGNLMIAALIPATLLGLRVGFGQGAGRVFSVAGRMRWAWLARCGAVLAPIWAAYLAIAWLADGAEVLGRPEHWVGLLVVSLLTTSLQAAAEEIFMRGGLVQGLGAWVRSPVVALGVTTLLSAALFALAHGSLDVWVLIDLGWMAAVGCWLTWRTGGLEAIIALHVVNNLLVVTLGLLAGGLEQSYVDTGVTSTPLAAGASVAATTLVAAVLLHLARRHGIAPQGWREPALG